MTKDQEKSNDFIRLAAAVITSVGLATGVQYKTDFRKDPYTGEQGRAVEARLKRVEKDHAQFNKIQILVTQRLERIDSNIEYLHDSIETCQENVKDHNRNAEVWIRLIEKNKQRIDFYLGRGNGTK